MEPGLSRSATTAADGHAVVLAVHVRATHEFSKQSQPCIELVPGQGVRGDAHFGRTVKHRSRVARDPAQPNLRQVHLLHAELFDDPAVRPYALAPGEIGENLTTRGIDLLALCTGTRLRLGADAIVEITGLRNPCAQIEQFRPGLLAAVLQRSPDGRLVRKAGVMGVVLEGGFVRPGDAIRVVGAPTREAPLVPV